MLRVLQMYFCVTFTISQRGWYYYLYFLDEETKAQRGYLPSPQSFNRCSTQFCSVESLLCLYIHLANIHPP